MNNNKSVLVSGAAVFRDYNDKIEWLLVKETAENDWEIPKTIVRKGESSVRAAIRMLGQKGSMTGRVLEEVGRSGGVSTVNGKTVPRRFIYYIMYTKFQSQEAIGYAEVAWLEYKNAVKKLPTKKEQTILKDSFDYFKAWKKDGSQQKMEEEDELLAAQLAEEEAAANPKPEEEV